MSFKSIREAIKEFNILIEKYPHISDLYIGRAKLYGKTKQYKKAFEDFEKSYTTYFRYDDIADICERNDLIKEAENFYTKAINKDKNATNYFLRAFFYRRINEFEKALDDCDAGLKLSPNGQALLILKKVLIDKLNVNKK